MTLTRRHLLEGAAAAGLGGLVARSARAAEPVVSQGRTKIVVLGSHGGQQANVLTGANVRCGTSVLIDVGGVLTVVDCGIGSLHRLVEAGYDACRLRNVLITHHHQDHNADLGNFAGFAWSSGRNGERPDRRLDIYGPTGTKAYENGYKRLARLSIADQEGPLGQRPTFDRFARWHEVRPPRRPRELLRTERLRVSCVRVHHGGIPSLAFRIRTPDVDLVLSGDRGPRGDSFVRFARGAELLFHEIIDRRLVVDALKAQNADPGFIRHLVRDHCDPRTVGRVATAAGVRTLVLYHLIPGNPGISDEAWRAKVEPWFSGRIVVARDLLVV
jgi:ribonuclease BN (tRNA processing enzyme)